MLFRNPHSILCALISLAALVACKPTGSTVNVTPSPPPEAAAKANPAVAPAASDAPNGSCILPDAVTPNLKVCWEEQRTDTGFAAICKEFYGTWSATACDPTAYATRCDDPTNHETHFYQSGSKFGCLDSPSSDGSADTVVQIQPTPPSSP